MKSPFPLQVREAVSYAGMGEFETRGTLLDSNGHSICTSDYLQQKDVDYLNDYVSKSLKDDIASANSYGINPVRLKHSLAVARKMQEITASRYPESGIFSKEMFVLGLLHDIGYEFSELEEDHASIGGELLRAMRFQYSDEVSQQWQLDCACHSTSLDILNSANLLIDSEGNEVTVMKRLDEIRQQYGESSSQATIAESLARKLKLI